MRDGMTGVVAIILMIVLLGILAVMSFQHEKEIGQLWEANDGTWSMMELMSEIDLRVAEHLDSLYRRTDAIMGDTTVPLDLLREKE